jgi:hypothetical protein
MQTWTVRFGRVRLFALSFWLPFQYGPRSADSNSQEGSPDAQQRLSYRI